MRWAAAFTALLLAVLAGALCGYWASSTGSASPSTSLACGVKASCGAGEAAVLRMSSASNAHAGAQGGSSYGNVVCCGGLAALGNSCSGTYDTVLTLSAADNAHAASDGGYSTKACLSESNQNGVVDCTYGATCPADHVCLATISGSTNAHVAACDGAWPYETKVCCQASCVGDGECDCMSDAFEGGHACLNAAVPDALGNADGDKIVVLGSQYDFKNFGEMFASTDPCVANPGASNDTDGDAFSDGAESFLGTDPVDACPDSPSDDAWPPDIDRDTRVSILDVLLFKPVMSSAVCDARYNRRFDFTADGNVNILDVLLYKPVLGASCTNP